MNNQENIDYNELVKENIYIAKLLSQIPENKKNEVKQLLLKKKKIHQQNGYFAEFRIERINKKINKYREEYNEKKQIY